MHQPPLLRDQSRLQSLLLTRLQAMRFHRGGLPNMPSETNQKTSDRALLS